MPFLKLAREQMDMDGAGGLEEMNEFPGKEQWYAAFVETGKEDDAKERLEYGFDGRLKFLVPKRRIRQRKGAAWSYVNRTLFPGYVLIKGSIPLDEYYRIKRVPGIWSLLHSGGDISTIPEDEMILINRLTSGGEIIGPSSIYEKGGSVEIVDGPLLGMEGRIVRVDKRKGRARINISFLGEERTVDLAVNVLSAVQNP